MIDENQNEEAPPQEPEPEPDQPPPEPEPDGEEDDSVVVQIGNEETQEQDYSVMPPWVKELRRGYERTQRKNAKLTRELEQLKSATAEKPMAPADPGPKPTFASCDYDEEKYEARVAEWHEARLRASRFEEKKKADLQAIQKQYDDRHRQYQAAKEDMRLPDFDDAEGTVNDTFSMVQRGIIISAADNPALLTYALGKNPKKLQELASIKDPIRFAFAAAKLEKELKVSKRKPKTAPEKTVEATGELSGRSDNLDRLRDEAEKKGSIDDVLAYRRKLRKQQRAG